MKAQPQLIIYQFNDNLETHVDSEGTRYVDALRTNAQVTNQVKPSPIKSENWDGTALAWKFQKMRNTTSSNKLHLGVWKALNS